jgi:hypothetical protein
MEVVDNSLLVLEDIATHSWWVVPLSWLIGTYKLSGRLYISFYTDNNGNHYKVLVDKQTYTYVDNYLHPKVIKLFQ